MLPRFEQFIRERQYLTNLSSTVTPLALFNSEDSSLQLR